MRFAKDEIVAVVLALPEPFAVLALMNRSGKFGDWQEPAAANEATLVAKPFEIREQTFHIAGRQVPVFALKHQQWSVLPENPLSALQYSELGTLHVDLE